jgi:hypothetical protein
MMPPASARSGSRTTTGVYAGGRLFWSWIAGAICRSQPESKLAVDDVKVFADYPYCEKHKQIYEDAQNA